MSHGPNLKQTKFIKTFFELFKGYDFGSIYNKLDTNL
jgi:hypothetical protein